MSTFEHQSVTDTIKAYYLRHPWLYSAAIILLVFLVLWASSLDSSRTKPVLSIQTSDEQSRMFRSVVDTLDEADDVRVENVAATIAERLNQWIKTLDDKEPWREDPFMTDFIARSLDPQRSQIAGLTGFDVLEFDTLDGFAIQESLWLSQVNEALSKQPAPPVTNPDEPDLARVTQLFDWTVRNIALEPEADSIPYLPWQVLFYGRGRVIDRAWIFTLLCRQAGYEAVMLGRIVNAPATNGPAQQQDVPSVQPWIPAVLLNGKLYLFEHEYGLPVYKEDGTIATLAEVMEDDSPLRTFDIPGRPYPRSAADLQSLVAMIEASPHLLTRKMFILENYLVGTLSFAKSNEESSGFNSELQTVGGDSVVLSAKPTAIAARLQSVPNLKMTIPWSLPYDRRLEQAYAFGGQPNEMPDAQAKRRALIARANREMLPFYLPEEHITKSEEAELDLETMEYLYNLQQDDAEESEEERNRRMAAMRTKVETLLDVLLKARLRHLEGILSGNRSASWFYQKARPSDREFETMNQKAEARVKQLQAIIQNSAESDVNRQRADQEMRLMGDIVPGKKESRRLATYWLGLLHYQKQSFEESVVYFGERFNDVPEYADSNLGHMAKYNLGRALEKLAEQLDEQTRNAKPEDADRLRERAQEAREKALALYKNETEPLYVPQARARATWLDKQTASAENS